jgi:hypothetical protein
MPIMAGPDTTASGITGGIVIGDI